MASLIPFDLTNNGFTAGDLNVSGYVAAVAAYQQVFIADGRPYNADIHLSGYHRIDFTNTALVGAASGAFTVGETVTQATSGAAGIFMETIGSGATSKNLIYRTTLTEFVITEVVTGSTSSKTLAPTAVLAPPHWLNWALVNTFAATPAPAFPDGGSNIMCLYDGRIWMNSVYNPNQWFATRQGDPFDLDTFQDDVKAALSSQSSEAGLVADALVSLIAYKDNYLIFGLANTIYMLRGGSTGGEALSCLVNETGIFSPDSWCWDNEGNLFFVGLNGFFKLPNGMATQGSAVDNISLRKLPKLFAQLKLNRKTDRVVLGFDRDNNIVNVSITMQDGVWAVCFAYDVQADAILPDMFITGKAPSSFLYMNNYQSDVTGLMIGCYDGYVRKFDPEVKDDDGEPIESFVLYGPITINQLLRANIKIKEIQLIFSEDTDGAVWEVYQAISNEKLLKGLQDKTLTPTHFGTVTGGGRKAAIYEKIAGESIAVLIRGNSSADPAENWGMEKIKIKYTISGRIKEIA